MKFIRSFFIVLTLLLMNNALADENPSELNLSKSLYQFTITVEDYNIAQDEGIAMVAVRLERLVKPYLSLGPELDWAIVGKRGGYFAGGINLGIFLLNKNSIKIASRTFFGGGGGGAMNVYAGGGMIFKMSGELIVPITKSFSVRSEFGLIRFLNGSISSKLIAGGISYKYYKVKNK